MNLKHPRKILEFKEKSMNIEPKNGETQELKNLT